MLCTGMQGRRSRRQQKAEAACVAWEAESDDPVQTATQPPHHHGHSVSPASANFNPLNVKRWHEEEPQGTHTRY